MTTRTPTERVPATAKGEATRAFLLSKAAEVFAERGYTRTALNDLIAASGLTKGAFYFYFRSKSALALAVLRDQRERWLHHVAERVLAEPTAAEQLRALLPAMVDLIDGEPGAWSVTRLTKDMAEDPDPEVVAEVSAPMAEWVGLVADIVRRGQASGDLRTGVDPHHVAVVLVGAFDGLKSITDVLDPGSQSSAVFAERAAVLLSVTERGLFAHSAE
jgi:AcrR family transcriptional regulator